MSLRYASRVLYQAGMRVMKDQANKLSGESTVKSLRDSASSASSSSSSSPSSSKLQTRRFSVTIDSKGSAFKEANSEKLKKAEESLRTVMYLSCWGPN